jgi:tetrahydromethanopterin S-methyltransferase subunit C
MRYFLVLLLAACGGIPEKVVEVKIPVPVSCVTNIVKPNFITEAQLKEMQAGNFVTALHIDRLKRISYIAELEAVISACDYTP